MAVASRDEESRSASILALISIFRAWGLRWAAKESRPITSITWDGLRPMSVGDLVIFVTCSTQPAVEAREINQILPVKSSVDTADTYYHQDGVFSTPCCSQRTRCR